VIRWHGFDVPPRGHAHSALRVVSPVSSPRSPPISYLSLQRPVDRARRRPFRRARSRRRDS
jgi:hypothetical protein